MKVHRGRRGVQAVINVDGRFHPIAVKVRELPGEQPGVLRASGHAAFLNQSEPAIDHAVVHRPVDPRVLMADHLVISQPREGVVHELGALVRPEAFDTVNDVEREFLRRRGHARACTSAGVSFSWNIRTESRSNNGHFIPGFAFPSVNQNGPRP